MSKLRGWKAALVAVAFVAWPLVAAAQMTQGGRQQPPPPSTSPQQTQPANPQQPQPANPEQTQPSNPQQPGQSRRSRDRFADDRRWPIAGSAIACPGCCRVSTVKIS